MRSDPLFGQYRALRKDPLRFMLDSRREHGDAAPMRFGWIRAVLLSDPARVRHVLQDNAKAYSKQTRGLDKIRLVLGNGLLTSEGEYWLRQRRILQPAFHKDRIREAEVAMRRAAVDLASAWEKRVDREIDVGREMMALTLRIVCDTLLGIDIARALPARDDVRAETEEIGRAVTTVLEDVNERTRVFFDVPMRVPTRRNRTLARSIATLDRIVHRAIDDHRAAIARGEPPRDLLTLLLLARDEETGASMTDVQLRDEVITFFLAGHETTANALAWTFYCLSKHPSADRALAADLARGSLQYANMVIKEAMRLYPPAWMIGRQAEQDDVVGGFRIPRGTLVFASPYVTHRHPELWENPEGFDPERFLPEREAERPRYAYYPFGGGPRLCIGQGFAQTEAATILSELASRFRLELATTRDVVPEPLITLRPRGALTMRLRRRSV